MSDLQKKHFFVRWNRCTESPCAIRRGKIRREMPALKKWSGTTKLAEGIANDGEAMDKRPLKDDDGPDDRTLLVTNGITPMNPRRVIRKCNRQR